MTLSRRHLMIASAAGPLVSACSVPSAGHRMTPDHALDALWAAMLQESPHNATAYGLDTGAHAELRTRWPVRSRAHARQLAGRYVQARRRLAAFANASSSAQEQSTLQAVLFALDHAIEGATFTHGDQTLMPMIDQEATPYPINQMIGLAASGPQLLAAQQPVQSREDAAAFAERLAALAPAIDAETQWFRDDAALGVRPPRFILSTMKAQLDEMLATPAAQARLVRAYAAGGHAVDRITALVEQRLYPAVARQREALAWAFDQASDLAGVLHLPDGERYYAWALRMSTSTTRTPAEVHALGLALSRDLAGQMQALLRQQGLTQGSIADRLAALAVDRQQRFANDERGRAEAIAHCNAWVSRLRAHMPHWSRLSLKAPVQVARVPPEREAGAAGAYMALGSFDGSRPSVFHLNLRDTASWPRWTLPTLVAHETLPGHVWQESFEMEAARRHPIRSLLRFNGYSEGWALYAERLVDEAGLYADEPLARLGHLQAQQLRATRLVVDTGLHAFGWSRDRAIQTMVEATGRPLAAIRGEVDRYCVKPGQACGYMVGQIELLRLRERWLKERAGDSAGFNDAVLSAGNLPLTVLDKVLAGQSD